MAPGTLFVVATPIGHLEDITLRGLRVLREVALVAAEDTRRTGNLLRHYGITVPLLSLHEHNEHDRRARLVERLLAGESVALVSDAGTPGISDPGALLVSAARAAGIRVEPVPGPSAITAALSASGLSFDRFCFAGFPPVRLKDRKMWLEWMAQRGDSPVVCFEAPHRIRRTLAELRRVLVDRQIIVARELTKVHEEWLFLPADTDHDSLPPLGPENDPRGEFVIIVAPAAGTPEQSRNARPGAGSGGLPEGPPTDDQIAAALDQVTEAGQGSRRVLLKAVAERLGLSVNAVYEALERVKQAQRHR